MKEYNHLKIEKKWQGVWEKSKIYEAEAQSKKKKFYGLIEFPYPSGAGLHVGHIRSNTAMDIISRKRRMEEYNVLYPIGWDAFGLPTENYAIKTGIHPEKVTKQNTDTFRKQLKRLGFSFDWSREVNTTDPEYYKWTQWIFLQFFKQGLAYKKKTLINWCINCKIGLANEEVVNGKCERCGGPTEKKEKDQWMLAITKYADRLDKDLDDVNYLEKIKIQQRNWIGKSEGAEIEFKITYSPSLTLPESLPPTPSEGRGEMPGYATADPKSYKLLYENSVEMRNNPTKAEEVLWKALKGNKENYHFRQQHIIDKFIVDFVCLAKKLVIEVDGDIHDLQKEKDIERTNIIELLGFKLIRFKHNEVIEGLESVLKTISHELEVLPFGEDLGGAEFGSIKIFTTRADTIFSATYVVLAPEHELVSRLESKISNFDEVSKYILATKQKDEISRADEEKEKTGVELKGIKAINPANNDEVPVFIADYVLPHYGTGAIMAVPAHDKRDLAFAEKYKIKITDRPLVEIKEVVKKVGGNLVTKFKLRDWIFSRQRYWGEPIPIIHCEICGFVGVPEKDLPVILPKVKSYTPTDTGESPLSTISKWVNTKCPLCKGDAKRETDTMPNWAGSSWYYLRYVDPKNKKEFASKKNLKYWLQPTPSPFQRKGEHLKVLPFGEDLGGVDWYNGGMEHTTLHLLYSRFWHKFLYDLKLVPTSEPYAKRTSHGMILAEGGAKMSKSKGNTVNPDDLVKVYGADTIRLYEMFMGPFDQVVSWNTDSMVGPRRFLEKVWKIAIKIKDQPTPSPFQRKGENAKVLPFGEDLGGANLLHKTIQKVSSDIEEMRFNTAVSSMMILVNEIEKSEEVSLKDFKTFLQILAPFAPHITEELWSMMGEKKSIHLSAWPVYDESLIKEKELKIMIQVNGKVRGSMTVDVDTKEEDIKKLALSNEVVIKLVPEAQNIKKIIYVKGRLINIVI